MQWPFFMRSKIQTRRPKSSFSTIRTSGGVPKELLLGSEASSVTQRCPLPSLFPLQTSKLTVDCYSHLRNADLDARTASRTRPSPLSLCFPLAGQVPRERDRALRLLLPSRAMPPLRLSPRGSARQGIDCFWRAPPAGHSLRLAPVAAPAGSPYCARALAHFAPSAGSRVSLRSDSRRSSRSSGIFLGAHAHYCLRARSLPRAAEVAASSSGARARAAPASCCPALLIPRGARPGAVIPRGGARVRHAQ